MLAKGIIAVATSLSLLLLSTAAFAIGGLKENAIYDSNPNHLWNRLNEALFVRTAPDGKKYGANELDILYWSSTQHLLSGPSHQEAIALLDEFIASHGENQIRDPLKHALLQRDLWELFDWSAKHFAEPDQRRAARELQTRLATLIRRLALTTNQIASLPDNYQQAKRQHLTDLPGGLFQPDGDWINVRLANNAEEPIARTHVTQFDGHSAFFVMLHLPGGRPAALEYLEKLRHFKEPENGAPASSLSTLSVSKPPQFPPNTEWALVRQMCVIDCSGQIHSTPITESIQLRRYLKSDVPIPDLRTPTNDVQRFLEFQLDNRRDGALRAIAREEKGFSFTHFLGQGFDPFEAPPHNQLGDNLLSDSSSSQLVILRSCSQCHAAPGILSVNSYTRAFASPQFQHPADLVPGQIPLQATAAIIWKHHQYDWGLMQGLWPQNP